MQRTGSSGRDAGARPWVAPGRLGTAARAGTTPPAALLRSDRRQLQGGSHGDAPAVSGRPVTRQRLPELTNSGRPAPRWQAPHDSRKRCAKQQVRAPAVWGEPSTRVEPSPTPAASLPLTSPGVASHAWPWTLSDSRCRRACEARFRMGVGLVRLALPWCEALPYGSRQQTAPRVWPTPHLT